MLTPGRNQTRPSPAEFPLTWGEIAQELITYSRNTGISGGKQRGKAAVKRAELSNWPSKGLPPRRNLGLGMTRSQLWRDGLRKEIPRELMDGLPLSNLQKGRARLFAAKHTDLVGGMLDLDEYHHRLVLLSCGKGGRGGSGNNTPSNLAWELIRGFTRIWSRTDQGIRVALPQSTKQGLRFYVASPNIIPVAMLLSHQGPKSVLRNNLAGSYSVPCSHFPFDSFFHPLEQPDFYEANYSLNVNLSWCIQLPNSTGHEPRDLRNLQWMRSQMQPSCSR
ncbi:hypothetical protein QYF61_027682 [Mycteria americana]|uniref:Uncharacterized protein n=1 Tax=Mycteria americana TaxID=33587 RepID=A0AAN7MLP3_MYCAM|nr:hypothetical protein QYF61_027682 [Mycteria americana]